jgi:CBS domain-containing protein
MMVRLRELGPVDLSVARSATFGEAARRLLESGLSAIAVLGDDRRVEGLFTEDDFLAGLFPRYLVELRHTAFAPDEIEAVTRRAREVASESVADHMRAPIVIEADSSAIHAAEIFLHCEWGALAVVDDGRFLGMLSQAEFCRRLLPDLES